MGSAEDNPLRYQRSRFTTRLPRGRLYTPSHYWLERTQEAGWQVGFTQFATRMLGDLVEFDFEVDPDANVTRGELIGWVEGFKAVTDVFSVADGRFGGPNPELESQVELIGDDPYGRGWLYRINGEPDPEAVDAEGYARLLDATIDKMRGKD